MLNTKIYKNNFDSTLYSDCAIWCNKNNGVIVEYDKYFKVEDNTPSDKELSEIQLKNILNDIENVDNEIYKLYQSKQINELIQNTNNDIDVSKQPGEYEDYVLVNVIQDKELRLVSIDDIDAKINSLLDKRKDLLNQYAEIKHNIEGFK